MRSRGTRIDDLTVEPIGENQPGFYRMIRFGNFSLGDGSKEMIVNKKELAGFVKQATKILSDDLLNWAENGKTKENLE